MNEISTIFTNKLKQVTLFKPKPKRKNVKIVKKRAKLNLIEYQIRDVSLE